MIARIFAEHGYNAEEGEQQVTTDGADYPPYEWMHLVHWRRANRIRKPGSFEGHDFLEYHNAARYPQMIEALPEPWVIKDWAANAPLYKDIDAARFCIWRNAVRNAESLAAKKRERVADVYPRILRFQNMMIEMGHLCIFTDDVINGDYASLGRAAKVVGFKFRPEIADAVVDPYQWHY
jgi:hypothetical protein